MLVDPLHRRVDLSWQAPVPDVFGVSVRHRILPGRVELEVVGVLEEVDLSVAAPHEGRVQVRRDPGKPVVDGLRVAVLLFKRGLFKTELVLPNSWILSRTWPSSDVS